jgi:hypothetical protein
MAPGSTAGPVDQKEKVFATPGPGGKWQVRTGPVVTTPDGRQVNTYFNPNDRGLYYMGDDGMWRQVKSSGKTPSMMTPTQYLKVRKDYQSEVNGLKALKKYFDTIKDIPSGVRRWAVSLSARAKTFVYDGKQLTPNEFNLLNGEAKVEALLGMFRESVVGPGVMTEYDARRVLKALGDNPGSSLQNPQVLEQILRDVYDTKAQQAKILYQTYEREAKARGETPEPYAAAESLTENEESGAPSRKVAPSSSSAPSGPKPKVVLPPKEKRIIGKTEYTAPDGNTFVWGRDSSGKVGWMPK